MERSPSVSFLPRGARTESSVGRFQKIAQKNRTKFTRQEILSTTVNDNWMKRVPDGSLFTMCFSFSLISSKKYNVAVYFPGQKWQKNCLTLHTRSLHFIFWRQKWLFIFWTATWQPRVPNGFSASFFLTESFLVTSERKIIVSRENQFAFFAYLDIICFC